MRKIIVLEHFSLDGVIQAPGGPDEDRAAASRTGGGQVYVTTRSLERSSIRR